MCCRRRQQNYLASTSTYYQQPTRRRGCCNSKRQQRRLAAQAQSQSARAINSIEAYTSNVYYPQSPPPLPQQDISYSKQPHKSYHQRKQCHGPFSMAALLIATVGLGAQKIKEKRDERKQKRAMLAWEEEQSYEAARKSALEDAQKEQKKSEEAAQERRGEGSRRSESLERERQDLEGPPPPSYEDVVADFGTRVR